MTFRFPKSSSSHRIEFMDQRKTHISEWELMQISGYYERIMESRTSILAKNQNETGLMYTGTITMFAHK